VVIGQTGSVGDRLPTSMRAAVLTRHGGPEAVALREVPVPEPHRGELLVRVAAAGVNNTDVWTREGAYGLSGDSTTPAGWKGPVDFPRIQGGDVAGHVVAVGEGVDVARVGTRVLVDPALYDSDSADALPVDVLGSERDGGFAEYVVVPGARAHPVDDSPLSDVELACLPIAYGTATGMLERAAVRSGDTVLVTGASGGVGLAAVQLARARGARVVAVSSAGKLDAVGAAGADVVIDRGRDDLAEQVRSAAPEGLAAAVDVVAGPFVDAGLGLLRPGGRWVVAGALGGYAVQIDVRRLYLANQSLVGSTMHTPAQFGLLVEVARRGDVRPVVAATYPLGAVHDAHAALEERRHVGKLVVTP
jgi:NADPH:quinone reductase-like Zn-dependent oxidoreductase